LNGSILAGLVLLQAAAPASREALNPWQLVIDASPVVKGAMVVLVLMAFLCWFIMGAKAVRISSAVGSSKRFLELFWGGEGGPVWTPSRLEGVYAQLGGFRASPIAEVFRAGYVELARVLEQPAAVRGSSDGDIDNVERALRRTAGNELTRMEAMLPFLATTASTAPFIGLFGTVWGIMTSFQAIAASRKTSLAVVAPGIAEALLATALGLLAAIPAVIAYNKLSNDAGKIGQRLEGFADEFSAILSRQVDEAD
jgi:biopolymer transport protein TolQ